MCLRQANLNPVRAGPAGLRDDRGRCRQFRVVRRPPDLHGIDHPVPRVPDHQQNGRMSNAGVEDSAPVPFRARLKKNWWRLALISATFEGEREGGSGGYSRRLDATGDRAPERMRDHLTSRGFTPQGKDSTLMRRSDGVVLTYTVCAVVEDNSPTTARVSWWIQFRQPGNRSPASSDFERGTHGRVGPVRMIRRRRRRRLRRVTGASGPAGFSRAREPSACPR